tara:strand:- start:86 stop:598 length:513 start_codon:yes stop_codon:yes gene_type:complete
MPCKKCKDGKYKWGETGECKYDSKESCEKANPKNYKEMKQYPTPLGKTYEEYEKELKEYNLNKVEKVELSLYSDLLNRNKTIKKELPNKQSDINEDISILKRKVKLALDFAETSVDYLESDLDKFAKATKELGLKPDDNDVYKDASKTVTQAKEEVKYYNKVMTSIKNYG